MFLLPKTYNCPWLGTGYVACSTGCRTWVASDVDNKKPMAHELGHNLGLYHSGIDSNNDGTIEDDYGDLACIMGSGYTEMNAPQRDRLSWYDAFPTKMNTISKNGRYLIKTLDNPSTTDLQILKINKPDGGGTYYVSFRTNGGLGMIAPYLLKVNIHRIDAGDKRTFFITSLAPKQSFTDKKNNITIKAIAKTSSTATVDINFDPLP